MEISRMSGRKTKRKPNHTAQAGVCEIRKSLAALADAKVAETSRWFFKTGPGEYGEGDQFIGIRVPVLRKVAKRFADLPLPDTGLLLQSPIHEERLLALLILILKYSKGNDEAKRQIYDLYLDEVRCVNNWDLVDTSAPQIVGDFLLERSRRPLYRLAKSKVLWERRIAIVATYAFIEADEFSETLKIAGMLLADKEDLIHKAVGWMLREVGKRDLQAEEDFLKVCYNSMPRTMLRYAIEKFPETKRKRYLKGQI